MLSFGAMSGTGEMRRRSGRRLAMSAVVVLLVSAWLVPLSAARAEACGPLVVQEGKVWTVHPSGGDDTANIQCALDQAAAAGPNAKVELAAGDFSAGLLTATDLHGTFAGAGAEHTILTALPDLDCQSRLDIGRGTSWIYVAEGNVHVRDITLEVADATPCVPWHPPWFPQVSNTDMRILQFGGPGTGGLTNCDNPDAHFVDGQVSDAVFLAPPFDPDSEQSAVSFGVWISATFAVDCPFGLLWPLTGSFSVQGSHFENLRVGVEAAGLTSGALVVGGSASAGNTIARVTSGISARDLSDSAMVVSHNRIQSANDAGVGVFQGFSANTFGAYPVPESSSFAVRHNAIEVSGFGDGVSVIDVGALISGEKTVDATVINNDIKLDNFFSGVFGFGSHDVAVVNNTFTGAAGEAAVSHGVFGDPSGNWQIVNNDLSGFEGGIAQIWLGSETFDDLVATTNPGDDVLDEGVNNTIVGPGGRIGAPRAASTLIEAHLSGLERERE